MADMDVGQDTTEGNDLDLANDEEKGDAELWSEFEAADASASGEPEPPPSDEPGPDDRVSAEADDGADDDATGKDAAASTDDSSDGKSGVKDDDSPDIWADAKEEQRAAYEAAQAKIARLEQADRSHRGRTSALQRQIDELRSQGRSGDRAAPDRSKDGDDKGYFGSDDWKSFETEYPEIATPLKTTIEDLRSQITRQTKELDAIGEDRRRHALSEQEDALIQAHPDWLEVTAEQEFGDWLGDQPRHIREAAIRNADQIVDAEEAADVVSRFKAFRSEQGGEAPPATDTPESKDTGNGTTQLSGKRRRQLESADSAPSRGARPSPSGISEDADEETIWRQFDELDRRQAAS